jgi:hypothetical protein
MEIRNIVITGAVSLCLGGCAIYDGAIYASYDQVDLGIRSAPETATPININFGRQHAVVSFVPHKNESSDGEAVDGEAVSVFGWANTASITPDEVFTENLQTGASGPHLLRAEGRFATGNAAKILVIPKNTKVVIQRSQGAPQIINIQKNTEERVGAAFSPSTRFRTPDDKRLNILGKRIKKCSQPSRDSVRNTVAARMGGCFKREYDELQTNDTSVKFGMAQGNCPGMSTNKLNQEIEFALKSWCST